MSKPMIAIAASLLIAPATQATSATLPSSTADYQQRLPEDEIVYVIMPDRFDNADPANDRGGLNGGREITGFDPADKAFYHGGDLKGVERRLPYIKRLGATAIWLTPVFRNKPVQTSQYGTSAGYHGYWPLDFSTVDPHLGTDADYRALVDEAHALGLKVYFDVVVNHTADVIKYRECRYGECVYRDEAHYPYTRRGGPGGSPINSGFAGTGAEQQTSANFARLTRPDYAYTPYVPSDELAAKKPDWLNDPIYYHNRGESTFEGESSQWGDFVGLDDVFTENPAVLRGFVDIYGKWIDKFGIDGFRIDTARHVNPEFWQSFVPAMLERAHARGIPNFAIFGEAMQFSPGELALHTIVDRLPSVNDFALQRALVDSIAKEGGTDAIANVFGADALYAHGEETARRLVTLTGNHDVLRFAHAVRENQPRLGPDEVLRRVRLAYAIILLARGVPTIYYGDEQGFTGEGPIDQDSREDMFPSKVPSYRQAMRLGVARNAPAFDERNPLFASLAELAHDRTREAALRRGRQVVRYSEKKPGLLVFSRLGEDGTEILAAFNTSHSVKSEQVTVGSGSRQFESLHGRCVPQADAPSSYRVTVPPLDFILCKAAAATP